MNAERRMTGWTVYYNTLDAPGQYVTRAWHVVSLGSRTESVPDIRPMYIGPDLQGARDVIPPGAYCIGRDPEDGPHIVEVWI